MKSTLSQSPLFVELFTPYAQLLRSFKWRKILVKGMKDRHTIQTVSEIDPGIPNLREVCPRHLLQTILNQNGICQNEDGSTVGQEMYICAIKVSDMNTLVDSL